MINIQEKFLEIEIFLYYNNTAHICIIIVLIINIYFGVFIKEYLELKFLVSYSQQLQMFCQQRFGVTREMFGNLASIVYI